MKPNTILVSLITFAWSAFAGVALADHHGKKSAFDLAGSWRIAAETDNETNRYTFVFEKKDDKLTGVSIDDKERERPMDRIKVEGKKVHLETDIERDGQKGIIRVIAEASDNGDKLSGKWSIVDAEDKEYLSGDLTGEREFTLDLAGDWDSIAVVGENERDSVTTFKKVDSKWTGGYKDENREVTFTKVETEGKDLTCEFVLEIEGQEMDFRITAKAKSSDVLEGKWVVFDASGQEGYSGKWTAKRAATFELAGDWNAKSEVNGETRDSVLTITEKDGKYAGKIGGEAGEVELTSVKLDDDKLAVVFPLGEVDVTIKATVKDGKLAGKWSVTTPDGDEFSDSWKAERKK